MASIFKLNFKVFVSRSNNFHLSFFIENLEQKSRNVQSAENILSDWIFSKKIEAFFGKNWSALND